MDLALRAMVDEVLRPAGFKGSLPHLRRVLGDRIDLISVQHASSSGSFVVEVACSPPGGVTTLGRPVPGAKVVAHDINGPRPRLGSPDFPRFGDHWFAYGPRTGEQPPKAGYRTPEALAADVADLIRTQAEPWWQTEPFPPTA